MSPGSVLFVVGFVALLFGLSMIRAGARMPPCPTAEWFGACGAVVVAASVIVMTKGLSS